MDDAPNFGNSAYPGKGSKIGPAWSAAWGRLADGGWHSSLDLAGVMMAAGGIVKITCVNLLRQARRDGLIEARRVTRLDGGAAPSEYRRKP